MKLKNFFVFLIFLVLSMIVINGCSTSQKTSKEAVNEGNTLEKDFGCFSSCSSFQEPIGKQMCEDWKAGKDVQWPPDCSLLSDYPSCVKLCETEKNEQPKPQAKERDDFGCWPPSCSIIPDSFGKQMCEDWKAGKQVTWYDCSMMAAYPNCVKLCEFEMKNKPQDSQNFPEYNNQQQDSNSDFDPNSFDSNQDQSQQLTGIPASDPESGSVYIYISDQTSSCVERCDIYRPPQVDSRIIRIDDMTGKNWISFGTSGKGVNQFSNPNHLTVGPDGKIYIADSENDRIVRIDDMTGKGWVTYGVSGRTGEPNTPSQVVLPPGEGRLVQPSSVKLDSKGRIYILSGGELARIDDITGNGWTTFGSSGSGVKQFEKGKALFIDSMDMIYLVDAGNHRIIRIDDMTGKGWITYGTKGSGIGQFEDEVNGVTLDAQGRIYIGDEHNHRIVRIDDMTGKGWVEFDGLPNDKFDQPHAFGITKEGHIYVLDTPKKRVVRIDDMAGKGWIAFAPYADAPPEKDHNWRMVAPHGMFVVEK